MQWALIYPPRQPRQHAPDVFAEVYPATMAQSGEGAAVPVPDRSAGAAALIVERRGEGLVIDPEEGGALDGIDPGPYRSLRDVTAAIAEYTGEVCRTLSASST